MMKPEEFVLLGDRLGQMIELITYGVLGIIIVAIGGYAFSRAVALAWFRTKLEFVRSVIREGARGNGEK